MTDETRLIVLNDCFTGGYTLPQYCIDNGIKKPLIVSEQKFSNFMWQVYVQFRYDKRLSAQFAVIDAPTAAIKFSVYAILPPLQVKNISEATDFDAAICLTSQAVNLDGKTISFVELTSQFIRKTYAEIPLLNFLQRHPRVKLFLTNFPSIRRQKGGAEFQKQLRSLDWLKNVLRKNPSGTVKTPLDKFGYTNSEAYGIVEVPPVTTNPDGTTVQGDSDHPLMMITGGKRMTANQPEKFLNKIYFVGSCHHYGVNAPYDKTIESYLQRLLNEHNLPYRVENESQRYFNRYQDIFYNLNTLNPAPGDIVFVWLENLSTKNLPFIDVADAFDPPNDYREIYCVRGHINELGYKLLAEKYFAFLTENNFFRDKEFNYTPPPTTPHRYGIPPQFESGGAKNFANAELEAYKQQLKSRKMSVGAIVMNCNPFTLGHRYLVEYAAAQVVKLYIFVVEEDKSEFPFADRFELVKQGVRDIANVEVIPSGKFIISQQTFSGYFNKAQLQDVTVDSSEDVEIFATEIAPTLGITIRFAGEEPTDNVTRQYNDTMKNILPRYGIEFREIPRKASGDEIISASTVRAALKQGDFDKIKRLVPETTYLYLRERYAATN